MVTGAVLLAGLVLGTLLTLPLWTSGGRRRRLVPALLSVHAGIVAVIGLIATAAAARSWQLIDRDPADAAKAAVTLLDVSHIDGDGNLYALLVLFLAFGTLLAVTALALAARFSAGTDPTERMVACAVLGLEICVGGYAAAHLLGGNHGVAAIALTLQLPLAMAAMVTCWPPAPDGLRR